MRWTDAEIASRCCDDGSHRHLKRSEVATLERDGVIEWVLRPVTNREKGIVRLCVRLTALGLSIRVGEYLATAIHDRRLWAQVMLAEIQSSSSF